MFFRYIIHVILLRSIKAYLCPNIINFDSVDFSEHRPEEVMFLLTLSVCIMFSTLDLLDIHVNVCLECKKSKMPLSNFLWHLLNYCPITYICKEYDVSCTETCLTRKQFKLRYYTQYRHSLSVQNTLLKHTPYTKHPYFGILCLCC